MPRKVMPKNSNEEMMQLTGQIRFERSSNITRHASLFMALNLNAMKFNSYEEDTLYKQEQDNIIHKMSAFQQFKNLFTAGKGRPTLWRSGIDILNPFYTLNYVASPLLLLAEIATKGIGTVFQAPIEYLLKKARDPSQNNGIRALAGFGFGCLTAISYPFFMVGNMLSSCRQILDGLAMLPDYKKAEHKFSPLTSIANGIVSLIGLGTPLSSIFRSGVINASNYIASKFKTNTPEDIELQEFGKDSRSSQTIHERSSSYDSPQAATRMSISTPSVSAEYLQRKRSLSQAESHHGQSELSAPSSSSHKEKFTDTRKKMAELREQEQSTHDDTPSIQDWEQRLTSLTQRMQELDAKIQEKKDELEAELEERREGLKRVKGWEGELDKLTKPTDETKKNRNERDNSLNKNMEAIDDLQASMRGTALELDLVSKELTDLKSKSNEQDEDEISCQI